jgi:hypothetical protein
VSRRTNILAAVCDALAETFTPDGVAIWLRSTNRSLGGHRPLDVILAGEDWQAQLALDLARSLAGGMVAT